MQLKSGLLEQLPISKAAINALLAEATQQVIQQNEAAKLARSFEFRGNNLSIQTMTSPLEILLCGAAGTGKTLAILHLIHKIMCTYAGARWLIARKVRADLAQSVLVTFENMLHPDNPIIQGARRENRLSYRYPNGSEIILAGMDRPGRILSAEFDGGYLAEAVQFEREDREMIISRLRNGVIGWYLLLMDTNPDRPDHHLKQDADEGKILLLNTSHKDNPSLYDVEKEEFTEAGKQYLDKLNRLSGVRRERYLLNKWVIAEGAIYDEWNEAIHLIHHEDLPRDEDGNLNFKRRFRVIDFGYTNPFVCQWWGEDHDGRLYLYREIYQTKLLVEDAAKEIIRLTGDEKIEMTIADHDAEDRATLQRHGITTIRAEKSVLAGIQVVKERLRIAGDGRARLFITRGARISIDYSLRESGKPTSTQEEIGGYVWNDKTKKEEPKKEDDHGVDAMRYAVMAVDTRATEVKTYRDNPFFR